MNNIYLAKGLEVILRRGGRELARGPLRSPLIEGVTCHLGTGVHWYQTPRVSSIEQVLVQPLSEGLEEQPSTELVFRAGGRALYLLEMQAPSPLRYLTEGEMRPIERMRQALDASWDSGTYKNLRHYLEGLTSPIEKGTDNEK